MIGQLQGVGTALGARFVSCALTLTRQLGSSLVVVEFKGHRIDTPTLATIRAANELGSDVTALVAGDGVGLVAESAATLPGVRRVLLAQHAALKHQLAEPMSLLLKALQERFAFSHILAPGSTFGKNILPRAAALLGVQPISDVVRIIDQDTFVRPIYAGNGLASVQVVVPGPRMLTVRPSAFPLPSSPPTAPSSPSGVEPVATELLEGVAQDLGSHFQSEDLTVSARPELGSARVVVCGGRGVKSKDNFRMMERLADALGGAVGASRAAVDAGFVPNDLQVGQTGKVVAPDLYIGIGVSGAIQHLAGMKDSKVIVAINNDAEAPIFQVADYGLVQDLFSAVPELEKRVQEAKENS